MPILPLDLPPGFWQNGTPYTGRGRWITGDLVRWHNGALKPIGGWTRRADASGVSLPALIADPTLEAVRDIFAWRDLGQGQNVVFGSNLGLYHMGQTGTITDVTYAGYVANNPAKNPTTTAGYGQNPYGFAAYGAANNLTGQDPTPPDRWYADNFGQVLLAGVRNNGGIYELDLGSLTMSSVTNSPTGVQDLTVTDQRQVLVIGGAGEPRRLQASDVEDRNTWTPTISNQAVDRTLPGTGRLLSLVPVLKQTLILGETDAHVVRYIGPPYVFSVELSGENCGPLAAEAVTTTDRFAVWWGERNFWIYDGTLQVLPCDIIDYLYDDLDSAQVSKISVVTSTNFSEITWFYQSSSSTTTEPDSYVTWDYREMHWTFGRLDRTAGVDKGVTLNPIYVSSEGYIYTHELDDVLPEGTPYVESGPLDLQNGAQNMAVDFIYPDTEGTGGVVFYLKGRQLPQAGEFTYGPYADQNDNPIPTRALGRSIRLRAEFSAADAAIGLMRLSYTGVGTGRR